VQAIGRQRQRAPDGAPVHYERHTPEQTTLYRRRKQHAATFIALAEGAARAELAQFVDDATFTAWCSTASTGAALKGRGNSSRCPPGMPGREDPPVLSFSTAWPAALVCARSSVLCTAHDAAEQLFQLLAAVGPATHG